MNDNDTIARLNAQHAHKVQDEPIPTGSVVTWVSKEQNGLEDVLTNAFLATALGDLFLGEGTPHETGSTFYAGDNENPAVVLFKVTQPGVRTRDVQEILEGSYTTWSHGLKQYTHKA